MCVLLVLLCWGSLELATEAEVWVEGTHDLIEMDVSGQGFALLLRSQPHVRYFDLTGRELGQWGHRGEGPGELGNIRDIATEDDRVLVLSKVPNKIDVFDTRGHHLDTVRLDQFVISSKLEVAGGRTLVQGGGWLAPTHALIDIEDRVISDLGTVRLGQLVTLQPTKGPSLTLPAPYASRDHWNLLSDGRLVRFGMNGADLVVGDETWPLKKRTDPVTHKAFSLWLNRYFPAGGRETMPLGCWQREAEQISPPTHYPPVIDLLTDGTTIWALRAISRESLIWERYAQGTLVAVLNIPAHYRIFIIRQGRVYLTDSEREDDHPFGIFSFAEQRSFR